MSANSKKLPVWLLITMSLGAGILIGSLIDDSPPSVAKAPEISSRSTEQSPQPPTLADPPTAHVVEQEVENIADTTESPSPIEGRPQPGKATLERLEKTGESVEVFWEYQDEVKRLTETANASAAFAACNFILFQPTDKPIDNSQDVGSQVAPQLATRLLPSMLDGVSEEKRRVALQEIGRLYNELRAAMTNARNAYGVNSPMNDQRYMTRTLRTRNEIAMWVDLDTRVPAILAQYDRALISILGPPKLQKPYVSPEACGFKAK